MEAKLLARLGDAGNSRAPVRNFRAGGCVADKRLALGCRGRADEDNLQGGFSKCHQRTKRQFPPLRWRSRPTWDPRARKKLCAQFSQISMSRYWTFFGHLYWISDQVIESIGAP